MMKIKYKWLSIFVLVLGSIVGIAIGDDVVYADPSNNEGSESSFNIYARVQWKQTTTTYSILGSNSIETDGGNDTASIKVIGPDKNGKYKTESWSALKNFTRWVKVSISGNQELSVTIPDCPLIVNPFTDKTVFKENIKGKTFNEVVGMLNGSAGLNNYTQTFDCSNGEQGVTNHFQGAIKFSISDVTDKDATPDEFDVDEELEAAAAATEVEPTCMNSGAGESMGWILCPILDIVSDTTQFLYNDFVEPALTVEPKLFSQDENTGTRYAWGVFQGVANTLFIILLLVVIFSQLTGVGIDNYGIKKILPKLITAAILINLSYIICLIFVDVSNILGNGLKAFFDNLPVANFTAGENIDIPMGDQGKSLTFESVGVGAGVAVALLAAVATQIWPLYATGGFVGILLALLTVAISVFIAIAFIFLLLAAREAAIIVLIVISPLAFACYILPNTKKLFDRWLGAGKALLLLYPICGLLMGGGNFVSRLLLTTDMTDGFFTALMAMLMGVIPLFFIPSLLKNSLNAMGQIGARISGVGKSLGNRLSSGADSTVRGSERFRRQQNEFARGRQLKIADKTSRRLSKKMDKNGSLNPKDMRYLARSNETMDRLENEDVASYISYINSQTDGGANSDKVVDLFKQYMEDGNHAGVRAAVQIGGRRKDTAAKFMNEAVVRSNDEYDPEMKKVAAREMTEGANSSQFKAANAFGFEYASQVNKGNTGGARNYQSWIDTPGNVDNAINNHITNSQELIGTNSDVLTEMARMMNDTTGKISEDTKKQLRELAAHTIDSRANNGPWDVTKAAQIYALAGRPYPGPGGAGGAGPVAGGTGTRTGTGTAT